MNSEGGVMDIGRSGGNGTGNRNLPGSSDPHVQEVVRAAHEELRQLMRQRADVMKRIGTVKQTIVGLANLFGDEVLSEELLELVDRKSGGRQPGFTKACRMVLMEAARPLGAREVCEQIQQRIPPVLLRHKDPLASVTTVLNRLVEYGEARTVVREKGAGHGSGSRIPPTAASPPPAAACPCGAGALARYETQATTSLITAKVEAGAGSYLQRLRAAVRFPETFWHVL